MDPTEDGHMFLGNRRFQPNFSNVVSLLALFVALGGTSYAVATGSIDSREIKNNTVRSKDLRNNDVRGKDVRNGSLTGGDVKDGALTAADVQVGSLTLDRLNAPGAVLMFNATSCPSGWSELTAARGRYVVGLRPGGARAGTAGSALTNLENRATGQHGHSISDTGHTHGYTTNWGYDATPASGTVRRPLFGFRIADSAGQPDLPAINPAMTGLSIDAAGTTPGTNAPYIQLLACQKQ
jgi:hypothetical protein